MQVYTYSEARQKLAAVLEQTESTGNRDHGNRPFFSVKIMRGQWGRTGRGS